MSAHVPRGTLYVAYARVSTTEQGRSGLGLEAQQDAIRDHIAKTPGAVLTEVFTEVESGKRSDRPQLAAAMKMCRLTGGVLLIAKLDRLARDAHFLLGLQKAGVEFTCADMPEANRLTVTILAAVAEEEARMISARTKAALAAAKARGVKLGGMRPNYRPPTVEEAQRGGAVSAEARKRQANCTAHLLAGHVRRLRAEGLSLEQVAAKMREEGRATPRGGSGWTATTVRRIVLRTQPQEVAA